ncbi:MAG: hypothetical protein ACRENB_05455 [Gemmatimonadales bacterium]
MEYRLSFEQRFERILWNSRLVILVAVAASMLVAFAMLAVATVDPVSPVAHPLAALLVSRWGKRPSMSG